jgi:hypothetical protein
MQPNASKGLTGTAVILRGAAPIIVMRKPTSSVCSIPGKSSVPSPFSLLSSTNSVCKFQGFSPVISHFVAFCPSVECKSNGGGWS